MTSFHSIHAHGLVRVGACTPMGTAGDPAANADAAIELARRGDEDGADLLVFPELSLTSYAIDDLHVQDTILRATEAALERLVEASATLSPVLCVGAALGRNGRIYNCAVAVHRGRILGVIPKIFLPNYREYYEKRWFASGIGLTGLDIRVAGQVAPFGTDLIFAADDYPDFVFHMEICEDFWAPTPPSTAAALAGATILTNLSASNIVIGKARERAMLCASQSARASAAYVYSATGPGESTTDLSWDGQGMIHELGEEIAQSERFDLATEIILADVDVARIRLERARMGTFNDAARGASDPETRFRRIGFSHGSTYRDVGLFRPLRRYPFVPNTAHALDEDCYEAFNIQVEALRKRLSATKTRRLVIGVSGGLDSTHALLVAAKAFDRMERPRTDILGFTLPGFATSEATRAQAWDLMNALGITGAEIDITPAARQMLGDMGHPFASGEPVHDVTFENVQAGLRTDYLFRLANQREGMVLGTGDLSELALGWCTYGVGDQMSHYAINAGVPKTLVQHLIRWEVRTGQYDAATAAVLERILSTEISPELVPPGADGAIQSTESIIGPYALHDFFLHHIARGGQLPSKVAFLAMHAWSDASVGIWPEGMPDSSRGAYDLPTIAHWLAKFLDRFFRTSQFKRSAIPNGPKVSGGGALSPRGDWRAPSDGTSRPWLDELRANLPNDVSASLQ